MGNNVVMNEMVLDRLHQAFAETLQMPVDSADADLLDGGMLDSLSLVTLMAEIEAAFGIDLLQQDFEIEQFRTLRSMAAFVVACRGSLNEAET